MFIIFYSPYYNMSSRRAGSVSLTQHYISKANNTWYVKTISQELNKQSPNSHPRYGLQRSYTS